MRIKQVQSWPLVGQFWPHFSPGLPEKKLDVGEGADEILYFGLAGLDVGA